jgi:hypothetical protein
MVNVLLVPINDLKSHPTDTGFISMGKSLVDRFNLDIFVLLYSARRSIISRSRLWVL